MRVLFSVSKAKKQENNWAKVTVTNTDIYNTDEYFSNGVSVSSTV